MGNLINLGKEVKASSPNGLGYKYCYNNSGAISTLTEVVNVSGSGFLKSAYNIAQSGSPYAQIKIEIDGVTIINLNNTVTKLSANGAHGIVDTFESGSSSVGYYTLPLCTNVGVGIEDSLYNVRDYTFNNASEQAITSAGALFVLPDFLRFEKSLKVSVKKETNYVLSVCEYYLD